MTDTAGFSRAEVCISAIADVFEGDGEILASSFGTVPAIGMRLARLTSEPELMMTDGIASLISDVPPVSGDPGPPPTVEGWTPFRSIFDLLWSGRRHVVMIASQIDRYGNQNFACIGDHAKPKAQLLGMRGAPGNTISHTTSYWIPNHSAKVFVPKVDVVSGLGYDRAAQLPPESTKYHEIRRVVSNLGVFDFDTPDHRMRLVSTHPGVSTDEVIKNTGFELAINESGGIVPETRVPSEAELRIIRDVLDPESVRDKEVKNT
jgi:acyl CoA:acetate/3-ketoacid CoA transferase beta subunit